MYEGKVMKWVKIPHGEFLVDIDDQGMWHAMKMEFIFRGLPWKERDNERPIHKGLSLPEFYMIASTCPCPDHMTALATAMGFTDSGYREPPPPF